MVYLLVLKGEWESEDRDSYAGMVCGFYRDFYKDPLPHPPLSTSKDIVSSKRHMPAILFCFLFLVQLL